MTEIIQRGNSINVDKNIVENINDFSVYGKEEPLVKSLLYYFAYQHKYHPEEFGILDPEKFADICDFDPGYLRRRSDEPARLVGMSQKQIDRIYAEAEADPSKKVMDSNLENALYKLLTTNIVYQNKARIYTLKDNTMVSETGFQSFSFLKNLKVAHIRTPAGRTKILYQYEVTESFRNHMGLYYIPCDLRYIVHFRKKRRDNLYLFLIRAREYCKYEKLDRFTTNLDQLCQWANLNLTSDREKKRKIKETFKDFEEKVDFEFTLEWHRREGERWEYVPVLYFPEARQSRPNDSLVKEKLLLFYNNLINELGSLYKEKQPKTVYGKEYMEGLLGFIQNGECLTEKEEAYYIAEKRSYTVPKGSPTRVRDFFVEASKQKWKSFDDIKKAIWVYHQNRNREFLMS